MDRDALSCWLHTVSEAKRHQENSRASLSKLSARFFKCKNTQRSTPNSRTIPQTASSLSMDADAPCDESSVSLLETDIDSDSTAMSSDFDPG
jgi:hypothetical protein